MKSQWYEKELAERLGVGRQTLAKLRRELDLTAKVDFDYGTAGRIYLTPEGVKKIAAALERVPEGFDLPEDSPEGVDESLESESAESPREDEGGAAGEDEKTGMVSKKSATPPGGWPPSAGRWQAPESREGRVIRPMRNAKLLEVQLDGVEGRTVVRVASNENFREGMRLRARPGVEGSIWYLDGRCPRFPGRW